MAYFGNLLAFNTIFRELLRGSLYDFRKAPPHYTNIYLEDLTARLIASFTALISCSLA
jgi:hypothetical protein